jgi:hypothetical protein
VPIGLTTVRQDAVLMAEHAVRFAVEQLENPQLEPREPVLDPKLNVPADRGPDLERLGRDGWLPGAGPDPQPSCSRSSRYSVARPMPSAATARDSLPPWRCGWHRGRGLAAGRRGA